MRRGSPLASGAVGRELGLCRQTVATARRKLEALGWYAAGQGLGLAKLAGKAIRVAAELLVATSRGLAPTTS